ncbi:MAG: hypothetical protein ACTSYR_04425 [Candidatus Odinarchaeia archaeon]
MNKENMNIENEINVLIQTFFKSTTIKEAKNTINNIKNKLKELIEYYSSNGKYEESELAKCRLQIWEAYEMYIDAKADLIESNISDERGQFTVGFSRGAIVFQSKKAKYIVTPNDLLNRIKIASVFMRIIRKIIEAPIKAYKSVKDAYQLIIKPDFSSDKNKAILFLKNWVKLIIQWKLEVLSIAVITAILKGELEEFKKLVEKHLELSGQLDALFKGQKYQKINIIDGEIYQELKKILSAKYYDLTMRKAGLFGGGGSKDIYFFVKKAEPIQDITIPSVVFELSLKELFPKELEV